MRKTILSSRIALYTNQDDSRTFIVDRVNFTIKSTSSDVNNSYTLALMLMGKVTLTVIANKAVMPVGQLDFNYEDTAIIELDKVG